jgi:hypothetical protein
MATNEPSEIYAKFGVDTDLTHVWTLTLHMCGHRRYTCVDTDLTQEWTQTLHMWLQTEHETMFRD